MRLILLLIIPYLCFAAQNQFPVINVKSSEIKEREVYETFTAYAKAKIKQRKDIFITTGSTVDFLSKKEGQKVKKDEIIAIFDESLAKSIKSQAESSFEEAGKSLQRNKRLFKARAVSKEALEQAQVAFHNAKLSLERANQKYEKMIVKAPFEGVIGVSKYSGQEYVKNNSFGEEYLMSIIGDPNEKIFHFQLPQPLLGKITVGEKIELRFNDKSFQGEVLSFSSYIAPETGNFTLKVGLKQENNIPDGVYIEGKFIYNKHKALTAPEEALSKNDTGSFIYLIRDEKALQTYVTTGIRLNGFVEIISKDIKQGDNLIREGIDKVSNGYKIKVVE